MSQKDQDKGKGSIDRRDFIKQTGLTIFGGIAFTALSGISPAFAETPGIGRLMKAVSGKSSFEALDWTCSPMGYTEPCNPQSQFGCGGAINKNVSCSATFYHCTANISCNLDFECYDGDDNAYGCTTRDFNCGASMDNHTFDCTGDFNCTDDTFYCPTYGDPLDPEG